MSDDVSQDNEPQDDAPNGDTNDSPTLTQSEEAGGDGEANGTDSRRRFFEIASLALGAIVSLGPALIGLFAFLDPLLRKTTKPTLHREGDGGSGDRFIRVASASALTPGSPQRFPVIDDQVDAWNFTPNQPIGSVYIEKPKQGDIRVFTTTCPHAGCSVSCGGDFYECPCHNSAFNLDGTKRTSEGGRANPSPRELDSLNYEQRGDEIWIEFKSFYTGTHEKKEKA